VPALRRVKEPTAGSATLMFDESLFQMFMSKLDQTMVQASFTQSKKAQYIIQYKRTHANLFSL